MEEDEEGGSGNDDISDYYDETTERGRLKSDAGYGFRVMRTSVVRKAGNEMYRSKLKILMLGPCMASRNFCIM